MSNPSPEIGAWYQTADGEYLEVVAIDPEEGVVEVQYYDGSLAEYDLHSWERELEIRPAVPPEDWSGSLDLPTDDYGVDLDRPAGDCHRDPFDVFRDDPLDPDFD